MNKTINNESLRLISFKCIAHHSYIILIYHRYMQQVPPSIPLPIFCIYNNFKLSAEGWQPNSNSCHSQTLAFILTNTWVYLYWNQGWLELTKNKSLQLSLRSLHSVHRNSSNRYHAIKSNAFKKRNNNLQSWISTLRLELASIWEEFEAVGSVFNRSRSSKEKPTRNSTWK